MNDLDRKIAELKGIKPELQQATGPTGNPIGRPGHLLTPNWGQWSTSDAKALELVDELTHLGPVPLERFCFILATYDGGKTWSAAFAKHQRSRLLNQYDGQGRTRPEAICRAYIAACEFLNQKGR